MGVRSVVGCGPGVRPAVREGAAFVPTVLIVQPIAEEGLRLLAEQGLEVRRYEGDLADLKRAVADVDAILVRDAPLPREVIEAAGRLKVIARHGAGTERIDIAAATRRGVRVTNTPVANSVSVAEHVMALVLALAKNLRKMDLATRSGGFDVRHACYGVELAGRTLGILGLGNVGRNVARMAAEGFGMKVLAHDPLVGADLPAGVEPAQREQVFREGDFVSVHLPLDQSTRGSIGEKELAMMKPTACLINCARGPIVDERALLAALRAGRIAGAGIDVYTQDPPPDDHPLMTLDNVILTPHTAAHTHEAMARMALHAAQGIVEVLAGREPTWPVN
jgi:D-3-phosphoglycerate dehydrogenase